MKLPDLNVKIPDFPRHVNISLGVMVACLVLFGVLRFTLVLALDDATEINTSTKAEIAQAQQSMTTARVDYELVMQNKEKFERLLESGKLVPHTRRDAARQLQALAVANGISPLTYDFASVPSRAPAAAASQAKSDAYRVDVEGIALKIGSALDGQVYNYLLEIASDFPGTIILQSFELSRAPAVTAAQLNQLSKGLDAGLVTGEARLVWRTAQSKDEKK